MTDENKQETQITAEQFQAAQAEIERLRKHNETLLAEKKSETEKRRAEQAEKDKQAEELARKQGDFETLEKSYQDKIANLEKQMSDMTAERNNDLIKSQSLKIASQLSTNAHNQEILQMLIEKRLTVDNGEVKVTDGNGNLTISSLDELVNEFKDGGLYGLSEGEVFGLVDGGKSIKLDGTPLINDNGQPNFENVTWEFRTGTIDQEHIKGFSSVENEQNIGVELRHDRPFTRAISNTQLSAVVIRLNWRALREQKDNGDIVGYKIDYAIDVQTDGGAWATVLNTTINDKASQGYQRSHRIDLPDARRGWTVRVRRITPNRDSDLIADTMSVQAITEVIDAKLRYPCTSLLAIKYDAQTFGNVAKVAVRMRGMIVQVPSNYNAQTRTYTGVWDGTFKPAYTNNPKLSVGYYPNNSSELADVIGDHDGYYSLEFRAGQNYPYFTEPVVLACVGCVDGNHIKVVPPFDNINQNGTVKAMKPELTARNLIFDSDVVNIYFSDIDNLPFPYN